MAKVIDLFSGCGGLSTGFYKDKYEIVTAVEFDDMIAQTYQYNHPKTPVIVDDIKNIDIEKTFHLGMADVVVGGPPCQGFSMAGARIRQGFIDDPRNYLFKNYYHVVKKVLPKVFIMENVKGITTMNNGDIFKEIVEAFSNKADLAGNSYHLYYHVFNASAFGVPQNRERMIIIGVLNKEIAYDKIYRETFETIKKEYPHYFDPCTVWEALSNLGIPSKDGLVPNPPPQTEYQRYLSCESAQLSNHFKTNHSPTALTRMSQIEEGENFTKLDEKINTVHSGSYGRLSKGRVAPTVTTRFDTPSGGRFIHPEQNRTITPREAARLQSFPDDYVFCGNKSSICKQIGNAVPPKISYFLAKFVKACL